MISFTVIVPVYNGERYLREAISSILSQTRPVEEIVVYDDSSTDASIAVCESFGNTIRIIRGNDGPSGFVNGWNKALSFASCDYISILHQDDYLYPDYFHEVEVALQSHPDVRHIFAVCDYVDEESHIVSAFPLMEEKLVRYSSNEYVKAYQHEYGQFPHIHRCPGVVTHKTIFNKEGCLYRTEAGHIADDDFFYRVGQYTDVIGVLKPLAAYRIHAFSTTGMLDDFKLIRRLSKDYLFQVRQWHSSSFLDVSDKKYFEYWALRYLFRTLIGSLRYNDQNIFIESSQNFASLLSIGLCNNHRWLLRKIQYLLAIERVIGFAFLGLLIRKYA
jgi:glycosyltransferase involved in cell wall biosynthesis